MKNFKRIVALAAAVTACFSASIGAYPAKPVSALTIIASITEASVRKDTIAVGETVPIELKWSTGREQEVIYASSDESVAVVDTNGVITGVGEGKATISITASSYGMNDKETTIDIIVSADVVPSVIYNTSELTLGQKLNAGDMLHYDSKNTGMVANVVNSKGSYDMAHLIEGDYLLPFNAEIVGIDGLIIYIAPELDNVTYLDARTLKEGDVVNTDTHLLCYDYIANGRVLPVFLPEYYEKYIGQGEIRVKSIDHESKKITLEAVPMETTGNYVKGDANGDGEFGIADAVTVQNWLLGKCDSVNMQNVDLCNDGKIDVYDFCLLRKELTSVKTESIEAIMSVDSIGYSDELLKLAKSDAPSAVITSCEELEAYLAPLTGAEAVQFYLTELYNESFFENNVLLANAIYQSCGEGVMYRIDSVYYEGDTLKVEYSDLYELRAYPDIVNGLFAQAVISKDDYHADNVIWEYTAE